MRTPGLLLAALTLVVGAARHTEAQRPDSAMVGSWEGRAVIDVPWTLQRELAIRLTIGDDGAVSGTVGDARLVDARFGVGRSAIARALRRGREYVVEGRLSGPIIRAEALQRTSVRIGLDWKGQTFEGELQTSGTYDGTPADLILTANGLVLRRAGPVLSQRLPDRRPR